MEQIKERDQIEQRYRWALEDLYPTDEAFEAALHAAEAYPGQLAAEAASCVERAETLLAFLRRKEEAGLALQKLITYAQRRNDEDTRVARYQEYVSQVMSLWVQLDSACSAFTPALMQLAEERLEAFYAQMPELEHFRLALDRVRRKRAHILSPREEALLADAGEMAQQAENIYSLFADADLTFAPALDAEGNAHPVTHGSYVALMQSGDRTLRKNAFTSMYGSYGRFRNTCAATLAAQVKQLKFFAQARKYPSALAASLDATEVPEAVYHNLIAAVRRNLDKMQRYTRLRKACMGLDELHFYDLYAPMVQEVEMRFTYEQAQELTLKALEPLGEEYLNVVRRAYRERWIDVYENPGKRSGAYSCGGYGMHPFMLLNFQGTLNDVFTLIHEMGHSMHTYLSCQKQTPPYSDYVIFVAEVASTCNEALLMEYLLKTTTDPKKRAYLINYFLEQFRTTLYRQTMFAEFELAVNEMAARGEGITAEGLCARYRRLNEDYFGPDIAVDEEIALEWARIPHFYYDYYVYQYATGYAAAIALSRRILNGGAQAVQDYLGFLSGGCSKDPIALLKGAGVDMATPAPVEDALRLFDGLLDEMEALLAK